MKEKITELIKRYRSDDIFRSRMILYRGTLLNACYAIFKLTTGLWFASTWLIAIAVFYLTLLLIKFFLVRQDIRGLQNKQEADPLTEWYAYRRTGWLMLLMNIGLAAINLHVIVKNDRYSYPGVIIYAIAFYAFYRLFIVLVRLKRGRHTGSPIFAAARAIDLSFAVTALYTLQTAMFASFSPNADVRLPNLICGMGAAAIVTAISISLIVHGNKRINQISLL